MINSGNIVYGDVKGNNNKTLLLMSHGSSILNSTYLENNNGSTQSKTSEIIKTIFQYIAWAAFILACSLAFYKFICLKS